MREDIYRRKETKERIKEKIIAWLTEEKISLREERDENASFNASIMFPPESNNFLNVILPKKADDLVLMIAGIGIDPRHRGAMGEQANVKSEFWWAVKFDLLRLFVDFTLLDEDRKPATKEVHFVNVSSPIYSDGLTKDSFTRELRRVSNARFMIIGRINQKFGEIGDSGF